MAPLIIFALIVLFALFTLIRTVRVIQQGLVGVVKRLGQFHSVRNPGITFLVPFVDTMELVDMRETPRTGDRQDVITRDNVSVAVNATIFSQVVDARLALFQVSNYFIAVDQLARSSLRAVLGADVLTGRFEIRMRLPRDTWVDFEAAEEAIHRAESAVAQGDWSRGWGPSLVALFTARRGFLAGEDLPWAEEYRRRLEAIRCSALECYAAVALGVGGTELAPGERVARELVVVEPFHERAHALLMEILVARGNAAEALRVYEGLRKRLRDELGATPAPELRALQERLLRR